MNVLKYELKKNSFMAAIWIVSILAYVALMVFFYPAMSASEEIVSVLNNFPEAFRKGFGVSLDSFSMFSAFYATVMSLTLLAGAVQAMNLGVGIVSREVRDKTADFLLSKPIGRLSVLLQKMIAGISILLVVNIFFLIGTRLMILAIGEEAFEIDIFLMSSLVLLFLQLFFFALGFMLGAVLPKVKSVIAVSLPVVFGFYSLGLLDTLIGEDKIKYITPFKLFDLSAIVIGDGYSTNSLIYLVVSLAIFVFIGLFIYKKKDIHSV